MADKDTFEYDLRLVIGFVREHARFDHREAHGAEQDRDGERADAGPPAGGIRCEPEEKEPPPEEDLAEVVRVARKCPKAAREEIRGFAAYAHEGT